MKYMEHFFVRFGADIALWRNDFPVFPDKCSKIPAIRLKQHTAGIIITKFYITGLKPESSLSLMCRRLHAVKFPMSPCTSFQAFPGYY